MIKLFKNFNKKEWIIFGICFLLIFFQVFLELKIPEYMSKITILVQTEGSKINDIVINGSYMILSAFGSLVAAVIVGYLIANVTATFSLKLRQKLFNKVEDLSISNIKKFSTSSLITRTTNDITQVETLIGVGTQLIIKAPITAIWAITKILNKSWQWSVVTSIAVLILLIMVSFIIFIVMPRFEIVQKLLDKLNGVTRENLTGIRVVRAFNAEKYEENKFSKVNQDLTDQQLFNQKKLSIMHPVMMSILYFLTLSIYLIGAHLIQDANIIDKLPLFGDMIVFSSYSMQIIMSFLMLAMIFMVLPRAKVSSVRINEVLDINDNIIDGKIKTNDIKGTIEFKNVSFKYPDSEEYLIKDISFKVSRGETVAFIGSTGSGKSTLINLIPRFYDVTEGEILVDNINVKDYKLESLYDKIGYVSQKAIIFSGSINSNTSFGNKKITKDKIKEAINVAQGKSFVEKMDNKYDSDISQSGLNLSGGQKQRLAIARAIAKDPEIYIFDDSFSALDYKTDSILRKELKKYTEDATVLIVAQRIGTILNSDKIVVLDNGKCVGVGTHKELLNNCEVYKEIAYSQLSKEELENA